VINAAWGDAKCYTVCRFSPITYAGTVLETILESVFWMATGMILELLDIMGKLVDLRGIFFFDKLEGIVKLTTENGLYITGIFVQLQVVAD